MSPDLLSAEGTRPLPDASVDASVTPSAAQAAETLTQWEADAAAAQARLAAAMPTSTTTSTAVPLSLADLAQLTGLQQFEAMLAGRLPPAPIAATLDFLLIRTAFGQAVFQGRPGRAHYNPMGSVHGGWFATLLDSAMGCAVHTTLPAGRGYTTLELKMNFVRALNERIPLVRAEGTVVHVGQQVATAEARLVGADGRLYAHASTTCLIFNLHRPARDVPASAV